MTTEYISDIIKKEHFDIALKKVLMSNSITSIKEINRLNFLEVFEKINGVEEVLKNDPSGVYSKMDYKTKEYYRNIIKEISKKAKISLYLIFVLGKLILSYLIVLIRCVNISCKENLYNIAKVNEF